MLQVVLAILEIGSDRILASEPVNLMMCLSKDVVEKVLNDEAQFERMLDKVNARLVADAMVPLGWKG